MKTGFTGEGLMYLTTGQQKNGPFMSTCMHKHFEIKMRSPLKCLNQFQKVLRMLKGRNKCYFVI